MLSYNQFLLTRPKLCNNGDTAAVYHIYTTSENIKMQQVSFYLNASQKQVSKIAREHDKSVDGMETDAINTIS